MRKTQAQRSCRLALGVFALLAASQAFLDPAQTEQLEAILERFGRSDD